MVTNVIIVIVITTYMQKENVKWHCTENNKLEGSLFQGVYFDEGCFVATQFPLPQKKNCVDRTVSLFSRENNSSNKYSTECNWCSFHVDSQNKLIF